MSVPLMAPKTHDSGMILNIMLHKAFKSGIVQDCTVFHAFHLVKQTKSDLFQNGKDQ